MSLYCTDCREWFRDFKSAIDHQCNETPQPKPDDVTQDTARAAFQKAFPYAVRTIPTDHNPWEYADERHHHAWNGYKASRAESDAIVDRLVEACNKLDPYVDSIICYASTMNEHEPNRIANDFREALQAAEEYRKGKRG